MVGKIRGTEESMPFPIGHGVIAASLYTAFQREVSLSRDGKIMLLCAGLAIVPDFDFIFEWGLNLKGWHRGFMHSITFGVALGLLAVFLAPIRNLRQQVGLVLAPVSHAPLDALVTSPTGKGYGVELLWPFSNHYFRLGLFDYFPFNFNPRLDPWSEGLFQLLKVSLIELIVVGPLLLFVVLIKKRH
jgi:membrane-bound metal-dependent hydrolase YbcI (DUF457 family)